MCEQQLARAPGAPGFAITGVPTWLQERLTELGGNRAARERQLSNLAEQPGGQDTRLIGDLGLALHHSRRSR